MANYPVYQHQNIVKYPNPRQSVVNWASAGDKIMRGITEGVEMGVRIKDSRTKSMVAAQNIAQSQAAVIEAKRAGDLDKMRADSRLQLDQLAQEELERQATIKKSALWLRKEEAESKQQTLQAETSNESSYILNEITAELLASPEAIEYKNLINRLPGANPIEQLEIRNEAIKYLEDEDGPVARIGGLTDRYYALNPEVKAKGGLDMNHSIPNRFQLDNILSSSQIDTGRPTFKKTINEYGEETTEQVPEILTPNQYLAKLSWDIDLAQKEVEKASPDTRAKLIEYLKKNMSPENRIKTGIKELMTSEELAKIEKEKPLAALTPEERGEVVAVKGYEIPTSFLERFAARANAHDLVAELARVSPLGQISGFGADTPAGRAQFTLNLPILQSAKLKGSEVNYWEKTGTQIEELRKDTPVKDTKRRAALEEVSKQIKKQITYLRSTYGIKESTPAAAAEDAVANIRGESSPSPFLNDAETKRRDAVIVQLRKIYADPATSAEEKKSIENRFKTNGISLQ